MEQVEVVWEDDDTVLHAAGLREDDVVACRWGFDHDGNPTEQTSFLLLDDGLVIAQPVVFPPPLRDWWYCDLVTVRAEPGRFVIRDLYVDVVVGPPPAPYRLLDLDELAAAMTSGAVGAEVAGDGLCRMQRFLDRRLNRRDSDDPSWPDFPPAAAVRLARRPDLPRRWSWSHGVDPVSGT